jgi:hypothetical protein
LGKDTKERKEKAEVNWLIAVGIVNDLELAENGRSTVIYVRALFNGALQRAMGAYDQNGRRGMTVKGYLSAWLTLQKHLHEARRLYQSHITTFCATLPNKGDLDLFLLESRHIQEFKDQQLEAGLRASTINGKLVMLDKAFDDAVRRGHMLSNPIYDEDYLDEERLPRKALTSQQLLLLHERWTYLGKTQPGDKGARAREWLRASKFGAYQGMRLGDAVNQIRGNIDFGGDDGGAFVTWTPEKTEHLGRIVSLPLHSELRKELLPCQQLTADAKLTPLLAQTSRPDLSTEFKHELIATGIDPEDHKLKSRVYAAVSFHSHKRFYLNCMEKALVPREVLRLLGLHSTDKANARYLNPWTKKDAEAWRSAIEKVQIHIPASTRN